ncbi:sulfotransferase family protein [Mycobacterium botniense]
MGRSGTSALTRVLSLCGATLPTVLFGANRGNPAGHWEPRAALDLNEAILYRHGSNWYDPTLRLQEEGTFDAKEQAAYIAEIGSFLSTLPTEPVVLIKEPRITVLASLWFEAARRAGFDIAVTIAVRHPEEVVASLAARDRVSPQLARALWLKYNLLAERYTRNLPRVFVEYSNLLDDWRREMTRVGAGLKIDLNNRDEAAIEQFLRLDLYRQRHRGPVTEPFGTDWISAAHAALSAAARDEPWDQSELDRVFRAYTASEHGFRAAFEDFHHHFNSKVVRFHSLVVRPSITKLVRVLAATAHRA